MEQGQLLNMSSVLFFMEVGPFLCLPDGRTAVEAPSTKRLVSIQPWSGAILLYHLSVISMNGIAF